jgi:hypothetical protein
MGDIEISLSDRWGMFGASGSGKTFAMLLLVRELRRIYGNIPTTILDSKMGPDFEHIQNRIISDSPPPLHKSGLVVWQQPLSGAASFGAYEDFFNMHLEAPGPEIIVVDETASLAKSKSILNPVSFSRGLKQGRSLKKCFIVLSQELHGVDSAVTGQLSKALVFPLNYHYDTIAAGRILARKWSQPNGDFAFWYRELMSRDEAREYESIQSFLRRPT